MSISAGCCEAEGRIDAGDARHELLLAGGWTLPETFDRGGLIGICNHGKSGA